MVNTNMSATARFIRNKFAMVYIFLPRMTMKHTHTLPIIPINATIPMRMYSAIRKLPSGGSGPWRLVAVVVVVDDHNDWFNCSSVGNEETFTKLAAVVVLSISKSPVSILISQRASQESHLNSKSTTLESRFDVVGINHPRFGNIDFVA